MYYALPRAPKCWEIMDIEINFTGKYSIVYAVCMPLVFRNGFTDICGAGKLNEKTV